MDLKLLSKAALLAGCCCATSARAASHVDWPTYGFDSVRWSYNPDETVLTPATVAGLKQVWAFDPGMFDFSLNPALVPANAVVGGQPVVAAAVPLAAGDTADLVLVGDNNGTFFALDANSTQPGGSVLWHQLLGTKMVGGTVNKAFGIRSTASVDRSGAGTVYAASNEQVFGLDLATGTILPGWPVSVVAADAPDTDGEIHDALNFFQGALYVGTSAVGSDTPPYYGKVVKIATRTHKIAANWYPLSGSGVQPATSGAGIWGWGGVAVEGGATGGVYVATGNAIGHPQQQSYAIDVAHLSSDLGTVLGAATPAYAATGDDDYGSTPLVFTPRGCATKLVVSKNKTGQIVVDTVAADGSLAVSQIVLASTAGGNFKGTAAFDPKNQQVLVTISADGPAPYVHGLAAFKVTSACAAPWLALSWETTTTQSGQPLMANGARISSPTVAGGLVYFGAETPTSSGKSILYAVLAKPIAGHPAGTIAWSSSPIPGTFDSSLPTVVNGQLFFSTASQAPMVYAFGLAAAGAVKK